MNMFKLSNDVNSLLSSTGEIDDLSKIGVGNNRVVYKITNDKYGEDVREHVVKIERYGVKNQKEWNAWEYFQGKQLEKYLVPVKYHAENFSWIIMPYYPPVDSANSQIVEILDDYGSGISETDFVEGEERHLCCDYASIAASIL